MTVHYRDTQPESENVLIDLIRGASTAQRISRVRSLSESTIELSRRAIRRANPNLGEDELSLTFISYHYGEALAKRLRKYLAEKQQ